jgi:TonB family protein
MHIQRGVRGHDVLVYFRVSKDGTVSNLRIDPSSGGADRWTMTMLDAVQSASPLTPPPEKLLQGDDHIFVPFTFKYSGHSTSSVLPLLPLMLLGRGGFIYNAPSN